VIPVEFKQEPGTEVRVGRGALRKEAEVEWKRKYVPVIYFITFYNNGIMLVTIKAYRTI
jgi:hypothetical protein